MQKKKIWAKPIFFKNPVLMLYVLSSKMLAEMHLDPLVKPLFSCL